MISDVNVADVERWACALGGAALAAFGVKQLKDEHSVAGAMLAPAGRGTKIRVRMQYDPPAGKLGSAVAWVFGEEPSQTIQEDLRRLKQMMEAGEVPTTSGQPRA